jgi:hypothetical protein
MRLADSRQCVMDHPRRHPYPHLGSAVPHFELSQARPPAAPPAAPRTSHEPMRTGANHHGGQFSSRVYIRGGRRVVVRGVVY